MFTLISSSLRLYSLVSVSFFPYFPYQITFFLSFTPFPIAYYSLFFSWLKWKIYIPGLIYKHIVQDPDVTIKKRAMELCFALINSSNIEIMAKDLIQFLRTAEQDFREVSLGLGSSSDPNPNPCMNTRVLFKCQRKIFSYRRFQWNLFPTK